jgi:DNA topoisomerase-1
VARDTSDTLAQEHGLVYVHDYDPGISRIEGRGGHDYVAPDGRPLRDPRTLERIRRLAIPPAWKDVWICADPKGHIQAIGRDARGRRQYRYHPQWRAFRDEAKFDRTLAFGRALPRLRARIAADLRRRGLPREKVLAAVVRLLEVTLIRVGNDEYAKTNKSFGLTTLRKRHVRLSSAGAVFEFRGKSGVAHKTSFHDRRLARVLRRCESLPGQRLFQYVDHLGRRHAIGSGDVNAYLRAAMGEDFSAKDFRTWTGTLLAGRALALQPPATSATHARKLATTCVKAVAGILGNTATVCRACYIHPAVLENFEAGQLSRRLAGMGRGAELALISLLDVACGGPPGGEAADRDKLRA